MKRRAITPVLLAFALIIGLVYDPFIEDGLHLKFALVLIFSVFYFISQSRLPRPGIPVRIPALLMALMTVLLIPGLFATELVGEAVEMAGRCLYVLVLVLLIADHRREEEAFKLPILIAWMVVPVLMWGVMEWIFSLQGMTLTHARTYTVTASFDHRNNFVLFVAMLLPLIWAIPHNRMPVFIRNIIVGGIVLLVVMLLNRTAWFVLLVYAAVFIMVHRTNLKEVLKSNRHLLVFGLSMIALMLVMVDQWYTIVHHFETLFESGPGTTRDRMLMMDHSLVMARISPWFGHGAGMWKVLHLSFSQADMTTFSALHFYMHPHNDYLLLAVEFGYPAALMYAGIHFTGAWLSLKRWNKKKLPLQGAVALTWIALVIASLTSNPIGRPEFLFVFSLLLVFTFQRKTRLPMFEIKVWIPMLLALAPAMIFTLSWYGRHQMQSARWDIATSQAMTAYLRIEQAELALIELDDQVLPTTYWKAKAKQVSGKMKEGCDDMLRVKPPGTLNHPAVIYELGNCALAMGDTVKAIDMFQNSIENYPGYQQGWLGLAGIVHERGNLKLAIEHFLKADINPENREYDLLGATLSSDSLARLAEKVPDKKMRMTLEAMKNTPSWSLWVIRNCWLNRLGFEEQAYLDACYYMVENCSLYDDCALAQSMLEKYLPHRKVEVLNALNQP